MTRTLDKEQTEILERLIDAASLEGVVDALMVICGDKADHLRHSWQDKYSAKHWESAVGRLQTLGNHVHKLGI